MLLTRIDDTIRPATQKHRQVVDWHKRNQVKLILKTFFNSPKVRKNIISRPYFAQPRQTSCFAQLDKSAT